MRCSRRSAPDALDDYLLGTGLRADLGLDLFAVVGGDLAAPGVGAVVLVDPAGGGVGQGGSGDEVVGLAWPGVQTATTID